MINSKIHAIVISLILILIGFLINLSVKDKKPKFEAYQSEDGIDCIVVYSPSGVGLSCNWPQEIRNRQLSGASMDRLTYQADHNNPTFNF